MGNDELDGRRVTNAGATETLNDTRAVPHDRFSLAFGRLSLAALNPEEATDWIVGNARDEVSCIVVTSNIQHLALAETDPEFREIVASAELNVADGWPLILASRVLGRRLPGRVAGVDLVRSVMERGIPLRVAVLGGPPGAAPHFVGRYGAEHAFVAIEPLAPGTWETPDAIAALKARLGETAPNLVLIAIGAPRQEKLAEELRDVVRGPMICCGASVEILAGQRPRAPRVLQKLGLEWAFRATLEPTRLLPRYVTSGTVFLRVLGREVRRRLPSRAER